MSQGDFDILAVPARGSAHGAAFPIGFDEPPVVSATCDGRLLRSDRHRQLRLAVPEHASDAGPATA